MSHSCRPSRSHRASKKTEKEKEEEKKKVTEGCKLFATYRRFGKKKKPSLNEFEY
jgi:hypothetical protein